jgi:UDP-glucose-4-epimerase GalE
VANKALVDQRSYYDAHFGGAGYIGCHAARELRRRGYEAVIYDNLSTGHKFLVNGFELVVGDLADSKKLKTVLERVQAVMHFAAHASVGESVPNPRKYFQNNVVGGLLLLNAVVDSRVRKLIFSSTCAIYGIPGTVPITEKAARLPVNPYGTTKLTFEHALEAYDRAYGLRFVSFRYFNAAGADESGEIGEIHVPEPHLISSAFEAIHGERRELEIFGTDYSTPDGTCIRDYIHVNDVRVAAGTSTREPMRLPSEAPISGCPPSPQGATGRCSRARDRISGAGKFNRVESRNRPGPFRARGDFDDRTGDGAKGAQAHRTPARG